MKSLKVQMFYKENGVMVRAGSSMNPGLKLCELGYVV